MGPAPENAPFRDRLQSIQTRIEKAVKKSGRGKDAVRLIAVTKTVSSDDMREACQQGIRVFGENKIQEAQGKMQTLSDLDIEWHFIGHLQKNKARFIPGHYYRVHSIDSPGIADALDKASLDQGSVTDVLLQVNVSGEESKFGIAPEGLAELAGHIADLNGLRLCGLMTLPPFDPDKEKSRPHFSRLRNLMDEVNTKLGLKMNELSMGMSHDFEIAIEEGATCVRIGTALFGARSNT